jgi:hypothetical protein
MFDDSLAPTYEPESIFRAPLGSELIAPIEGGYLAQLDHRALKNISRIVGESATTDVRVTVSRIENISTPTEADILRGRTVQSLWDHAIHDGRGRVFTLWLAPYRENAARSEVAAQISKFASVRDIYALADLVSITREHGSDSDQLQVQNSQASSSISRAIREYRQNPFTRLQVAACNPAALTRLVALALCSGSSL